MAITDERKHAMTETAPAAAGNNSISYKDGKDVQEHFITSLLVILQTIPRYIVGVIIWAIVTVTYAVGSAALLLVGPYLIYQNTFGHGAIALWTMVTVSAFAAYAFLHKHANNYVTRGPRSLQSYLDNLLARED